MHWRTRTRTLIAAVAISTTMILSLAPGCDRRSNTAANTSPTTAPAVAAKTATTAPTSQPAAVLTIDGKSVEFPAAKLVLTKKTSGLEAVLCSDDPPAAIEPGYAGNSFMLEMKLDIDDPADLPTAVWEYKTERREPQDSPNGIFLNGAHQQMQPADVRVTFHKQGDRVVAAVSGKFVQFETHDVAAPVQVVDVAGKLDAGVQEQ